MSNQLDLLWRVNRKRHPKFDMYNETKIAIEAAKIAGTLLKKRLAGQKKESQKTDGFQDIVTDADFLLDCGSH